jgi:hypothetical protein
MNSLLSRPCIALLFCAPFISRGQVVLRLDFNDRSSSLATNNLAGFDPFVIGSVGSITLVQTNPTILTVGALTVTLSGNGPNPGYDDRLRNTPGDSPTLPSAPLYRDFVFSTSTAADAGLNVTIDGLMPGESYKVTLWSFDTSSGGTRVADWFANGTLVVANYTFDGGVAPTTDTQYTLNIPVTATESGQVLLQGRRKPSVDTAGAQSFGVFLNALQVETAPPEAPAIIVQPQPQELFAGDNAIFTSLPAGSSPITVQWYHGENPIEDATNTTLRILATSAGDAGEYSMIAASPFGSATSQIAVLTVTPVVNLASGLVGHWPLDTLDILDGSTPDVTPNTNALFQANMDVLNVEEGRFVSAIRFNGVDEYVARTNSGTTGLPLYGSPSYTVAMWVNGVGIGQNCRRVWSESANTNRNPLMTIGTDAAGTNGFVDIFIRGNSGASPVNHRRTSLTAFDGSWHHIAWVDNNGFGRVYVDGVPDTNDFNYTRVPLQGNVISLGAVVRDDMVAFYNGQIDDVHAWRRSLSEEEVRLVMNQIRVLSLQIADGNVELTFITANASGMHRVEERNDFTASGWSEVMGVNFEAPSGNTVTATFPAPMGEQRFHRVAF